MAEAAVAVKMKLRRIVDELARMRVSLRELLPLLPVPVGGPEGNPEDLDQVDEVTELRSVILCVDHDSLRPALEDLRGLAEGPPAAEKAPVEDPAGPLKLHEFRCGTQLRLYDLVVRDNFRPQGNDSWVPPYSPDEAYLEIHWFLGRWFATWTKLEEPADLPECERRELLCLVAHPDDPSRIVYIGV